MLKKLFPYMGGYRRLALITPLLMILEVACELALPRFMANIVDVGIVQDDLGYILKMGGIMLVLAVCSMLCGMFGAKFAAVVGQGFGANLRRGIYNKVQEFSFADIDRFSSASLITRITNDVNAIQMMVTMALRMLVRAPVMLVAALAVAISINAQLAVVMLVTIPLLVLAIGVLMTMCNRLFQVLQKRIDALNGTIQENLVAIRVVKAFVREGPHKGHHQRGYAGHRHDPHYDDRHEWSYCRCPLPGRAPGGGGHHAHRRSLLLYHLYIPDPHERYDVGDESAPALPVYRLCPTH